ncbi:ribosome hibernation-promoting factor, HPF/YfiA family [Pseudonocardia halophobica]|uniref:ribosome hibernation-promoting factor, HPF/YfiA family n=1 Tax=Pseudonocardia halophobica TaxID=29401 RepID=UPI003D93EEF5
MEIVVSGRNVEVPEHFRIRVEEKIGRVERYDHKLTGVDVELVHEPNRRQSGSCQRVKITGRGCQPMVRAEACAQDFYGALDCAGAKLARQLRRSHDRRRITARRRRITAGPDVPAAVGLLEQLPGVGSSDLVPDDRVDDPTPASRDHDDYLAGSDLHYGRSPSAIFGHDSARMTQPAAGRAADPVPEGDQATGQGESAGPRSTARNRR